MGEIRTRWRPDHDVDRGRLWVLLDLITAYLSAVIAIGPSDHTASMLNGPVVERVCAVVWFAAIAGRRYAPGCALWAAASATVAASASGAPVTNVSLATALALTLVVQGRPPQRTLEIAVLPVAAALAVLAGDSDAFVPAVAVHAVAWLVGRAGRSRRETVQALRARDRERAVTAERTWMARELHDAVGHAVTVMVTHAGAARLTLGEDRSPVREALSHIEEVGRGAMTDLDRVLGLLTEAYDSEATLRALVDQLPPGVTADLRLPPDPARLRELAPAVAETVRRVVQESLTNVVRHARPAHAVVRVDVGAGAVRVTVTDDGTATDPSPSPGGRGLTGMRERVTGLGGTFEAGDAEHGGWRVTALIPFKELP
ncbi:sensor histidine kinase [Streptomyces yerevanensis]|uniref:sensor histidine kinase n=1 Tax=Streptomyces yerevanensis TaxID=66378 RepID=UPI00068BE184|nr:sensor histidine kinase [Streptomyces yerevanensis]